ncbi:ATP-dependent DNA helicase PIF1-like [Durio zibethinus]|uniref:ATP-dependent DNA helicase n=1 Tax=Durio zibethinus TaxID=66656 RepID=A0A6P6BC08_DURZI|nr:ATP-dependent DNA helicase PIF1-like [Durio zibethinus]
MRKIMGMKFFANAISVYRNYSSKSFSNSSVREGYRSGNKNKKNNSKTPKARFKWTDEQSKVLDHVRSGRSLFITGSAGTGKTVLLKHIIKLLKQTYGKSRVFVTASTGIAACAIRGQTLHSFAGIGIGDGDREMLVNRVINDKKACIRWNKAQVLVIDEISLVEANLFDNLEYIAKAVRDSDKVWGGIRLVVSGDFFQLPPIFKQQDPSRKEFAFEADCWDSSFDIQVELSKIFRQSEDRLIKLLQGIRRGNSDPEDLQILEQSCSVSEPDPSVVRLYPRIDDVNKVNEERMKALSEEKVIYEASDEGEKPWRRQLALGLAPNKLVLCKGARVMLIKNLNVWRGFVNGATGTVTGFTKDGNGTILTPDNLLPVVEFDSGREIVIEPEKWYVMEGSSPVARRLQLPLVLAWAISIHKCQGMSLDHIHTDLSRAFGCGMVYVALSRVRSLDGLHLSGFSPSKIKAHPKVLQFYSRFAPEQEKEKEDGHGVVADKKEDTSNNSLSDSDRTSDGKTYQFSLKEFLFSLEQKKFSLKDFLSSHLSRLRGK